MIGLQRHLESLLTGASGTTRTISTDRFRLLPEDTSLHTSASDRTVRVRVSPSGFAEPYNGLDGFSFDSYRVRISIWYNKTNAGGDQAETLFYGTGSSDEGACYIRWATDVHDILSVLDWYENHGSDPQILTLEVTEISPELSEENGPTLLRGDLVLDLTTKASRPGSYVP